MRALSLLRPNDTGNAADGGRGRVFLVNLREAGNLRSKRDALQYSLLTPVLNLTIWLLKNQALSLSLAFTQHEP